MKTEITREDLLPMDVYASERGVRRRAMSEIKRNRRLAVGPDATFYFESYATMYQQIHEMLYIEKGGEEQIADELAAYNPLIPGGRELVATLMFEIDDAGRRERVLAGLGGVEKTITLRVGGDAIPAVSEQDVERTTADGKTSSVHFLHFPFTDDQAAKFRDPAVQVVMAIEHPAYGHMAVLPENVREALAGDFA